MHERAHPRLPFWTGEGGLCVKSLIQCEQTSCKRVQGSEPARGVNAGLHAAVVRHVRQRIPVQQVLQAFCRRLEQGNLL